MWSQLQARWTPQVTPVNFHPDSGEAAVFELATLICDAVGCHHCRGAAEPRHSEEAQIPKPRSQPLRQASRSDGNGPSLRSLADLEIVCTLAIPCSSGRAQSNGV